MRLRISKSLLRCSVLLALGFLTWQIRGFAQDTVVPAGTLIHCTLNEPNFSSATASVGDPVVCQLTGLQMFGRTVFPRGSYLAGHLEADKEPGHFFGKGYLRLVFDRIGFPNTDVPVPGKVIAARGYKVNKQGDIVGHGHATRDAVEWMLPPLWPWKVISLPARGPRPALKGEEQLTLRLMEDIAVPRMSLGLNWHYFGEPAGHSSSFVPKPVPSAAPTNSEPSVQLAAAPSPSTSSEQGMKPTTLIVFKSGDIYAVFTYQVDHGQLNYVLDSGDPRSVPVAEVDWLKTSRLNESRNSRPSLRADMRNFN
jgi:hypothetical protein